MPNFTLPPDTRAVGSGNPPADMNAVVDALTAQGAGLNVLNASYAGGADPTGAADSTAAIQAALNAATAGQYVTVPAGTYKISSPLTMPNGVGLRGSGTRSFGVPTGNYGNGGLPLTGTIIQPSVSFSGAAVISLGNAPASQAGGQVIERITIDGSQLPSSSNVAGIQAIGWVGGVTLREVLVWSGFSFGQMLGPGIDAHADGSGHAPDFWTVTDCKVSGINGIGINLAGLADSYFHIVEATGNGSDNWKITNGNNSRYVSCKGEGSSTGWGWNIIGASGFTGHAEFTSCSSASNGGGGVQVSSTGTGIFQFANLSAIDGVTTSGTNTFLTGQPNAYTPADMGFIAWTHDPVLLGGGSATPTSGTIYLYGVMVKTPRQATGIRIFVNTAASGLTASQCFVGLYNAAGTRIGVSADQSGAWGGTNVPVDAALAGGPFGVQPGQYWVAFLANGTTPPKLGQIASSGNSTQPNGKLSGAALRYATNGTGTSLPSSITPGSNAAYTNTVWAAVY